MSAIGRRRLLGLGGAAIAALAGWSSGPATAQADGRGAGRRRAPRRDHHPDRRSAGRRRAVGVAGVFPFAAGTSGSVLIRGGHAGGLVIADAVRFAPA